MISMIHIFYVEGLVNELHGLSEEKFELYKTSLCATPVKGADKYVPIYSFEKLLRLATEQHGHKAVWQATRRAAKNSIIPKISLDSSSRIQSLEEMIHGVIEESMPYISGFKLGIKIHQSKPMLVFDVVHPFGQTYPLTEVYFALLTFELLSKASISLDDLNCQFKSERASRAHSEFAAMFDGKVKMSFSQKETGVELKGTSIEEESIQKIEIRSFARSLEVVMTSFLSDSDITLQVASSMTSIPSRTIQRRLQHEEFSFQKMRGVVLTTKARELVEQGFSMTDIAAELHFSSVGHFSRFIKNLYGQPPKQLFTC